MTSYLWLRPTEHWQFWCSCAWSQQRLHDDEAFKVNTEVFGDKPPSEWANFGCRAKFYLWKRGASKLLQMKCFDEDGNLVETLYFLAERPPQLVDDIIKQHQSSWTECLNIIGPDALRRLLPVDYPDPKFAPKDYPGVKGVGFFPVDDYLARDGETLRMYGWGVLLCAVALQDLKNLGQIFTLGSDMMDDPENYQGECCQKRLDKLPPTPPEKVEAIKDIIWNGQAYGSGDRSASSSTAASRALGPAEEA